MKRQQPRRSQILIQSSLEKAGHHFHGHLLIALHRTILGTALPRIASGRLIFFRPARSFTDFRRLVLSPRMGRRHRFHPRPDRLSCCFSARSYGFSYCTVVFEIRSFLCGVSQNVNQPIAGRTVSVHGSAGIPRHVPSNHPGLVWKTATSFWFFTSDLCVPLGFSLDFCGKWEGTTG
ncbi:hypothetical protein B0H19DRAFT_532770 [Mycena capillaripes]|nr:hypothetical protein B0H19DRAFT_532770 [Mycena capillaripes]